MLKNFKWTRKKFDIFVGVSMTAAILLHPLGVPEVIACGAIAMYRAFHDYAKIMFIGGCDDEARKLAVQKATDGLLDRIKGDEIDLRYQANVIEALDKEFEEWLNNQ